MSTTIKFIPLKNGETNIELDLNISIEKKGDWYFAFCKELKISGYSKTSKEDAAYDVYLNAKRFIDYHSKAKRIFEVLESFGWVKKPAKKRTNEYHIPSFLIQQKVNFISA